MPKISLKLIQAATFPHPGKRNLKVVYRDSRMLISVA